MHLPRPLRRLLLLPILACSALSGQAADQQRLDGLVLPFREVVVASPVQSVIVQIAHREGASVKAGDVLAQLYSRIEELDMLRTKAALEKREFDFKGSNNLYADKIISQDEALKNKIELELARLQAEQATELFKQRTLLAPIDGLIVEQMREVGESVTATQPVFRLVDIAQVYVQFYIRAEELGRFALGDAVEVHYQAGDRQIMRRGKVDFIDPRVDAASGLLRVKVLVPNPDRQIMPGLRVEIAPAS